MWERREAAAAGAGDRGWEGLDLGIWRGRDVARLVAGNMGRLAAAALPPRRRGAGAEGSTNTAAPPRAAGVEGWRVARGTPRVPPLAWLGWRGGRGRKRNPSKQQPPTAEGGGKYAIVTTACIPWLTGTSVNPLLRAAYLSHRGKDVTLVVPWLAESEQPIVFAKGCLFRTPKEQVKSVEGWLARNLDFTPASLRLQFYPGRYSEDKHSILPVGDLTQYTRGADTVVLEEPEHLTWYHHGRRWTDTCSNVVGVVHTNYVEYARREPGGFILAPALYRVNQWVCSTYCHKVIKLSGAVQPLPYEATCNINGCSKRFLDVGDKWRGKKFTKGAYYLGKMQWGKGHRELVDLLEVNVKGGGGLKCDVFGSGDDAPAIVSHASSLGLPIKYHGYEDGQGKYDHADDVLQGYKVFINPSKSDVVATTNSEALAMGKFLVVEDHPSNLFFRQFPNTLLYTTPEEFAAQVEWALRHDPVPLTRAQRHQLSWEAATDRLILAARPPGAGEGGGARGGARGGLTGVLAQAHAVLAAHDILRSVAGAGPVTKNRDAFNLALEADVMRYNEQITGPLFGPK